MKTKIPILLLIIVMLVFASNASAGGWAVVSLKSWPAGVRAGETTLVEFTIRQHGMARAPGYQPVVRAQHAETGERLSWNAFETDLEGDYAAEIEFPTAGSWNWSISYFGGEEGAQTMPTLSVQTATAATVAAEKSNSLSPGYFIAGLGGLLLLGGAGFFTATRSRSAAVVALSGIAIVAAGLLAFPRIEAAAGAQTGPESSDFVALTAYDQGRILFQAKGCIVCHNHEGLREEYSGLTTDIGPNFTWGTKRPMVFLKTWLADPQGIKPETIMPNLELSEGEIDSLVAFLMGELGP